jgi:hypothetical protein
MAVDRHQDEDLCASGAAVIYLGRVTCKESLCGWQDFSVGAVLHLFASLFIVIVSFTSLIRAHFNSEYCKWQF